MTTWAIGDLQGCYDELRRLLDRLAFDPRADRLLFTGDLVNRGPQSLECLRFVRSLAGAAVTVLGNHDLHLLAVAQKGSGQKPGDTLDAVLAAPDAAELLDWLARQPLAWRDSGGALLVHAGLPPQWDVDTALRLAAEVSAALAGPQRRDLLAQLYGDSPDCWDESLDGWPRLRFVVNCLTRLRYCAADGRLALRHKGRPGSEPPGLFPWFAVPGRRSAGARVIFGHWSTLGRVAWSEHAVYGLDTGCIWGGRLTALDLDRGRLVDCACPGHQAPGGE